MQSNNLETFPNNGSGVSLLTLSLQKKKKKEKRRKKPTNPTISEKREASESWYGSSYWSLHQSTLRKTFLVALPNKATKTYCQSWSKIL